MIPRSESSSQPFWDYTDLFFFILLLFASFGGLLFVVLLLRYTPLSLAWKLLLPQLVFYALGLLSLATILRLRYDQPLWRSLGWKPTSLALGIAALLAGPLLAVAVVLLSSALHTPAIDLPLQPMLGSPATTTLLGIVVVILGPVCEELAFRGFLMPLLIRSVGGAGGIVLTGFIFGGMHGYEYDWSWQYILLISLVGCLFGWTKYQTQSTAIAAFMHSTYNLTQFAALLVRARSL